MDASVCCVLYKNINNYVNVIQLDVVTTVSGCLRETRYTVKDEKIVETAVRFCNEGQQSMMKDSIGLHKVVAFLLLRVLPISISSSV